MQTRYKLDESLIELFWLFFASARKICYRVNLNKERVKG